ncbi:anthranilate phosphoribosyltransferase TrpD [Clostridium aceticum]|uniref:Anthranilate phosphoribosyltransferase n=1 Tax=Clostridium aceticum TaxID=84022 RepID=A0A0D8IEF8_9CLOT|nr:anthranilate phosphoribosyltransferase [Clostridium aceticum]AKL93952.1 anthranilate phosphoribosyltransferase TrpD [Clostridium aceticum]KJF28663.1 anthranilate phosphoribosyltransferase [Clostridium aceticum]
MIQYAIDKVTKRQHLTEEEMMEVMKSIMEGEATASQIGGFLTALRMKGETVEEIIGSAKVMRKKALKVDVEDCYAIDTCGTGGDHSNTFNISTTVAFVAAAAGVTVIKHGNRSVTSSCGSADVLEKLGVNIQLTPQEVKRCVEELNIGFMFAPNFHQAMKHAVLPRRELGIRTIFNILGPLTNPAAVQGQVLGVFDDALTETMAEVLMNLGVERAMVVHGCDGLDEITISDKTKVSELKDKKVRTYEIDPRKFDLPLADKQEIQGGDVEENAKILLNVLQGERGGKRNMILLNAGAAIYVGKAANSLEEGIDQAREVIDMGLALDKLHQLIAFSQEMKQ